jgi:hypothetical protein
MLSDKIREALIWPVSLLHQQQLLQLGLQSPQQQLVCIT